MSKAPALIPHPDAELLPSMTEAEFAALKADIAANGQRDPIVVIGRKILDGRHRYRACVELGVAPRTVEWDGQGDSAWFVYSKANHRHLTDSQRAAAAVALEERLGKDADRIRLANLKQNQDARVEAGSTSAKPQGVKSRDAAGAFFGVSGRYVQAAKLVRAENPDLFRQVFDGRLPLSRAARAVHRETKRKAQAKHAAAFTGDTTGVFEIKRGDVLKVLPTQSRRWAQLVFADPPYNIGIDYGGGRKRDLLKPEHYLAWCAQWMTECAEQLKPDGAFWVLINDEWAAEFVGILKGLGLHQRAWVKWYETFGVNCANNFNRTSRHLLYFTASATRFVFNREAVTRKSARQEVYGDKRANPDGKVWDDVWNIPRLVANAPERVPGFPTQLPLALVRPIVACCTDAGDWVMDPFCGSGTTGHACVQLHRRFVGVELNPDFARKAEQRLRRAMMERGSA